MSTQELPLEEHDRKARKTAYYMAHKSDPEYIARRRRASQLYYLRSKGKLPEFIRPEKKPASPMQPPKPPHPAVAAAKQDVDRVMALYNLKRKDR